MGASLHRFEWFPPNKTCSELTIFNCIFSEGRKRKRSLPSTPFQTQLQIPSSLGG